MNAPYSSGSNSYKYINCRIDSINYNTAAYNLITKSIVDISLYFDSGVEGNLSYMPGLILDDNIPI